MMSNLFTAFAAAALVAALGLAGRTASPAGEDASTIRSNAPEAGMIAVAGPVRGQIRLLYARNGGMVLLREISVPEAAPIRELSLSADGRDLFVATDASDYAFSTLTGRIEAQSFVAADGRGHAGLVQRFPAIPETFRRRVPAMRS
jgi:hypothetical protein